MNDTQEYRSETTGRMLGIPMCTYRPQKVSQVALLDISAGGVRLRLDADRCRQLPDGLRSGDAFIVMIVFADWQGDAEPRQIWFKCECRHTGVHADGNPLIGLQFHSWSLTEKLTDPIVWTDLEEHEEVPPLFEWLIAQSRATPSATEGNIESGRQQGPSTA